MLNPKKLFHGLPTSLREVLVSAYVEIARNYAEHRWEPSELNGGKLCEVVYSIVLGATTGVFPAASSKPANMVDSCRAIEQRPPNAALHGDRSLRILIPRLLPYLYEIRNNRGVGHVGGDVSPNNIDAASVLACSNWLMAELVRIFHNVSLNEAQTAVDALVERRHPIVWVGEGIKRVLDPKMQKSDQTLVLLYSSNDWVTEVELRAWVEYKNASNFNKLILKKLHGSRMIEHDQNRSRVQITPRGALEVEKRLLNGDRS